MENIRLDKYGIPFYQSYMLPILKFCDDTTEHNISEIRIMLQGIYLLTEEQINERNDSGTKVFGSRISVALKYLNEANLLDNLEKGSGIYKITNKGKSILSKDYKYLDKHILSNESNEFKIYLKRTRTKDTIEKKINNNLNKKEELTSLESLEDNLKIYRAEVEDSLLDAIHKVTPTQFERLCGDILRIKYYNIKIVGRSGDGGIDIEASTETLVNVPNVIAQAKQQKNPVGVEIIDRLNNSKNDKHSLHTFALTTSTFTSGAINKARGYGIGLINGEMLVKMMYDNKIGVVSDRSAFYICTIDNRYFAEL